MARTTEKRTPDAADNHVVLMYSDNQLTQQVRDFGKGTTAFSVIKKAFFPNK